MVKEWLGDDEQELKKRKLCPIAIFKRLLRFIIKILSRIYGEANPEH